MDDELAAVVTEALPRALVELAALHGLVSFLTENVWPLLEDMEPVRAQTITDSTAYLLAALAG